MKRLAVLALVIASLACSSNAGTLASTSVPGPTNPPPTTQLYQVGDVVAVGDQTVTLNSAAIESGILKANFTVTNGGSADLSISQYVNFSAKDSEGVKLEVMLFDCGSSIDGTILPGDKVKGDICWQTTGTSTVRIYYEANIFQEGAVVWEVMP